MRHRTIELKPKPAFKAAYQSLLSKDWSIATLRKTLELMGELLRVGAEIRFGSGRPRKAPSPGLWSLSVDDSRRLLAIHREFEFAGSASLPEHIDELLPAPAGPAELALRVWVYLDLQILCKLRGDVGFFRDLQSVLFLNTVESLLPDLRDSGLKIYDALLANVLEYHAVTIWRDDPAHQQYLLSVLAHDRGDRDLEDTALLAAFRLTDPQAHDYLTLAQSYWHFLIESNRYEEAETFLLGVYRSAPQEQLGELKSLLDDTFAGRPAAHA